MPIICVFWVYGSIDRALHHIKYLGWGCPGGQRCGVHKIKDRSINDVMKAFLTVLPEYGKCPH